MENKKKPNRLMFYIGIVFVFVSVALLIGGYMMESNFPIILGGMGLVFITVSRFHLLK